MGISMEPNEEVRLKYLSDRLRLLPPESWQLIDQWPLYAGTQNVARYLFIAELFRRTLPIMGHVAEFGCWKGATTSLLAKLSYTMLPAAGKIVHAFDTFGGFDQAVQREKGLRSDYKGNLDVLEACLTLNGVRDRVEIHVGKIEETTKAEGEPSHLSLAYLDVDLFEPMAAALAWVYPRLSQGGLIVFDQFGDAHWPGEEKAGREFLLSHPGEFVEEATGIPQPSLVLVRR